MQILNYIKITVIGCVFSLTGYAQSTLPDNTGQPLATKSYVDVQGSPFLLKDWVSGVVKLSNGDTFKDVPLKYNELDDVLYYKNAAGQEFMFASPVQEFILPFDGLQRHFKNGYAYSGNIKAYYEVLSDGKVQLLKRSSKTIHEEKDYNSATATQRIVESINYYLLINEKLINLKKDKKFILATFSDKQEQLDNYLKTNNINFKNDADLVKFISYYNSL